MRRREPTPDLRFSFADAAAFAGADALAVATSPGFEGPRGFGEAVLKQAASPLGVAPREVVAYALVSFEPRDNAVVLSVHTTDKLRRRGVATALYGAVERHYAVKLRPSVAQTREGAALWRGMRRRGRR